MARQYYKDTETGNMKPLGVKVEDTLPVGTIVEYNGQNIPEGWVDIGNGKIEKQYQVIPTNAKLENGDSTSATNGYTADYINDHSVVVSPTEPSGSARKKVWKQHGELFNKNNITDQSYISDTNGTITSNVSWLVTDYIEVSQGEKLIINGNTSSTTGSGVYGIYYNSSKNVVSSIAYSDYKTNGTVLTIPNGVSYVRLSVPISEKNTFSIKVEDKEYILNNNVYEEFNNKLLVEKRLVQISLASSSATNVTDCAITAPKDGLAIVKVSASFSGGSTGVRYVNIYGENGQLQAIANSQVANQNGTTAISGIEFVNVKAGATYMPRVEQTSGSALTVYCSIQMLYI